MLVCDPWMGHINDMISCIYDSYYEAGNCSDVKRRKEDLQFNIIINFPQHQVLAKLGPGHLGLGQLGPGPNLLGTQHQSQWNSQTLWKIMDCGSHITDEGFFGSWVFNSWVKNHGHWIVYHGFWGWCCLKRQGWLPKELTFHFRLFG